MVLVSLASHLIAVLLKHGKLILLVLVAAVLVVQELFGEIVIGQKAHSEVFHAGRREVCKLVLSEVVVQNGPLGFTSFIGFVYVSEVGLHLDWKHGLSIEVDDHE